MAPSKGDHAVKNVRKGSQAIAQTFVSMAGKLNREGTPGRTKEQGSLRKPPPWESSRRKEGRRQPQLLAASCRTWAQPGRKAGGRGLHSPALELTYGLFNRHKRLQETEPEDHLVQLDLVGFFQTKNDDMDRCGIVCSKIVITAEVYRISRELPHTEIANS